MLTGRFGPYVQLGDQEAGLEEEAEAVVAVRVADARRRSRSKKRCSCSSLPRVVGTDSEGREIVASPGRFGPYLKRDDGDTRSLAAEEQLLTVTLEEAEALFAQPKQRRGRQQKPPIAELGAHPDSGAPVRVLEGRYGPYVTDGSVNATVPRGQDPAELTLDEAVELLRARAEAAPSKVEAAGEEGRQEGDRRRPTKKAAKKAVKKAKKAAKKVARRRRRSPVGAEAEPPRRAGTQWHLG